MKTQLSIKNTLIYFLGMNTIAVGVLFMLRSNLGSSSWDSLHFALHNLLPITIGWAMILVAGIFTFMVIYLNKSFKYLIMFVPILLVGFIFDFFDLFLFVDLVASTTIMQVIFFTLGMAMLPLGGSLLIISTYPAGVFDEFMIAMMRKLQTDKLILIRVTMELSAVTMAFLIGQSVGIGLGKIWFGTMIFSIAVGPFVQFYLKMFEKLNMYEDQGIGTDKEIKI